jgi:DNA invertase Pin-like site-specific DNA recombinase
LHYGHFGTNYRIVQNFIGIFIMIIGVARTSTLEQVAGLEAQVRQLEEYGCERVYQEQVSSVGERVKLEEALGSLRAGDKLVVTKLDRLARSVQHLGQIIDRVNSAGASLVILDMGGTAVDTSNATGKLILNVMSSVSQFEREMMLERQREGIAKAKAEGKYKGRKPTARAKTDMVKLALANGVSKPQICKDLGISRTSLYRIMGNMK